jgi:hypothetical protein
MGGTTTGSRARLIRAKRRETNRELKAMRSAFDRKIYSLEPSPQYLNAELASQEEVTEILKGKVRHLFGEVGKIKTECANSLRRMRDKQKNEIQDIKFRHELKKQDLLKQQKRMWQ